MRKRIASVLPFVLFAAAFQAGGQSAPDNTVDLSQLVAGEKWAIFNRKVSAAEDGDRGGVHMDEKPGQGLAWLPSLQIGDATIEIDLKGRNTPGRSFVGLAFHGKDAEHYEAVYLRPFNFRADTEEGRSRSVQYVQVPSHEWRRLRTEHPGEYEAAIVPPPAPDGWVKLRLDLEGPTVRVYINGASEPTLVVDRIGSQDSGWIGLWVGDNSDGSFANLKITSK